MNGHARGSAQAGPGWGTGMFSSSLDDDLIKRTW